MSEKTVLGLDIGTNSVGWALVKVNNQKIATGIIDMGARVFEGAVSGDISLGNEESNNAERRAKRLIRRQLNRRKRRLAKLFCLLQRLGLLPEGETADDVLRKYDVLLLEKYCKIFTDKGKRYFSHTLLYRLRAYALDNKLEDFELGRILYHLAQRRGFLSNRKTPVKNEDKDKDKGAVKKGISDLKKAIEETNSRTLGEYFSKLNPEESGIRGRWTSRSMYLDEFEKIWRKQSELNSKLNDELKKEIFNTIFFQRPLKSVKGFIGECTYEEGKKRCPWHRFEAQKYRLYSNLNNLRIIGGNTVRELTSKERVILSEKLENSEKLTTSQAKKIIGLPLRGYRFSIEDGGETKIIGNRTNARLLEIFGEGKWNKFSELEKEMILEDLVSFEDEKALAKRAEKIWGLDKEKAAEFAETCLEEGYCSLSRKAINKLLPRLKEGWALSTVIKETYGNNKENSNIKYMPFPIAKGSDSKNYIRVRISRNKNPLYVSRETNSNFSVLPIYFSKIRNPIVNRSINQTRKIVNAIINKYGKPDYIHIELARDMKNSKKQRGKYVREGRDNENNRKRARKIILEQAGIENPSREDVLRVLLGEECGWICPYTGRAISVGSILGKDSQFDIEHIIPFSRSLDDSFLNKTLCYNEENRNVKKNQTPYEAYGNSPKYEEILQRVSGFYSQHMAKKLYRFKLKNTEELENFSNRQLNDTRYASREAVKFLSSLYGGEIDKEGTRRIQAVTGGITYFMRALFGMNNILGDGEKTRDDHRHHAIDALAIAMTNQHTITWLTENASLRYYIGRFSVKEPKEPWNGFFYDLKNRVGNIITSHYISKKIRGSLHKETIYGKSGKNGMVKQRVALKSMSLKDVEFIIDKAAKSAVLEKLEELGSNDPKKCFTNKENLPILNKGSSEQSIIRKAILEFSQEVKQIGSGSSVRSVVTGNNHHIEIVACKDSKGREKWDGHVVPLIEAVQRLKSGRPVVKREWGDGNRFICSLACGDIIELDHEGKRELFVIRTVPESKQVQFVLCNTAKKQKDLKSEGAWLSKTPDTMREANMKKMSITPLGEIRRAND